MKLVESFLPGAPARIEAELKRADAGDTGFAFALALVSELASKMDAELKAIRADVAERQKSLADHYTGPWRIDQEYQRNALVTHRNSLWLSLTQTDTEPGKGPTWKMVSKGDKPA
ncbi:MAG: hypothetical protein RJQ10_11520 [Haliea sp.]|uniref:hypothetical protein n=1 Tax=Haliea sp. TaxID=1932666 RepID=UPI0032EF8964